MTVREINHNAGIGKHVIASYFNQKGEKCQGRIYQAKLSYNRLYGKLLNTGRWIVIGETWIA